jgi:ribosome-associated protein
MKLGYGLKWGHTVCVPLDNLKVCGDAMERIEIITEYIKLDQLLKYSAVCESGAEAKAMIGDGKVKVNGKKEMQRGKKIRQGDVVEAGEKIMIIEVKNDRG